MSLKRPSYRVGSLMHMDQGQTIRWFRCRNRSWAERPDGPLDRSGPISSFKGESPSTEPVEMEVPVLVGGPRIYRCLQ
jgi:hypothetical protein